MTQTNKNIKIEKLALCPIYSYQREASSRAARGPECSIKYKISASTSDTNYLEVKIVKRPSERRKQPKSKDRERPKTPQGEHGGPAKPQRKPARPPHEDPRPPSRQGRKEGGRKRERERERENGKKRKGKEKEGHDENPNKKPRQDNGGAKHPPGRD